MLKYKNPFCINQIRQQSYAGKLKKKALFEELSWYELPNGHENLFKLRGSNALQSLKERQSAVSAKSVYV